VSGAFQVGAYFIYPVYSGQVVMRLRNQLGDAKEIFGEVTPQEETVARLAQTEAQQMISRDILTRAVADRDILKTEWHKSFLDENGQFIVDEAVDDLEDDISSGHRRGTQFFLLYWGTHVPGDVPIVLNTIADTYLDELKSESDKKFNSTKGVFVQKQEDLDKEISSRKAEIAKYIKEEGIPSYEENAAQTQRGLEELQRRITATTMELSLVKSQRTRVDAKLQGKIEPTEDDVRKADQDPAMVQLSRDINDISINLSSKRERFGASHPEVIQSEHLLASAQAQRRSALDEIVKRELRGEYKKLSDQVVGYEDLLKQQTKDYSDETKRVEGLASRVSELEAKKDALQRLEEERAEITKAITDLELARSRIDAIPVEKAQAALTPREISFPNPKVVLPGVWFMTLAFGVGLIFLKEMTDQRVRFASDLIPMIGGKLLGVVPDLADDDTSPERVEFVVRDAPQSVLAESYRTIWSSLSKALVDEQARVVGVVSSMPDSGTTALISNLAASAATVGKRVLVLDANFRKPGAAGMCGGVDDRTGLGEVLSGAEQLNSVIQHTPRGIDLISAGRDRPLELFETPRTASVIGELKGRYDLILVDAAPVALAAESLVIANSLDAVVVVVRAMRDERGLVARVLAQLGRQRATVLGAVLSRPQQTASGYYRKNAQALASYTSAGATKEQAAAAS
jgi:capsular exopolysaccharide synthesis family protein